jgi:hypothetical protein
LVHATHEAGAKVGGIGAVLAGLLEDPTYNSSVGRSILVGPMYGWDPAFMSRLVSAGNGLTVLYSALHGVYDGVDDGLKQRLQDVEREYNVAVLYGKRRFGSFEHEVLLVDASNPDMSAIDSFKFFLWRRYAIDCMRYEHDGEFNLFVTIAQPLLAALRALNPDADVPPRRKVILAHEWMGLPFVFAAQMIEPDAWKSVFYAHETATARRIVEEHGGHDIRFYNVMSRALSLGLYMDDMFGSQDDWHKAALIHQAAHCDSIFAVGDRVVEELRFMSGDFRYREIDLVYNGAPQQDITMKQKAVSVKRLRDYAELLVGFRPDYVFTHVARMTLSKAFWRDISVLEHLAPVLEDRNRTAVLFVLATSVPAGRQPEWVHLWETEYGWPVSHRADNGDLIGQEVDFFFHGIEPFNERSNRIKTVLINQFGWSRDRCGQRMPKNMVFNDIRQGAHLEFGQSYYEPFGIAQVEPLTYGALTCPSTACGCLGFIDRAVDQIGEVPNVVPADYLSVPAEHPLRTPCDALYINRSTREWIEEINSQAAALAIADRLPKNSKEAGALLESGRELARAMSWERVVADYFLPAIEKTIDS